MKRRAFLTMLGLAPVVAQALPRPANPAALAKGGPVVPAKYVVGENPCELIIKQSAIMPLHVIRSKDNKLIINLSEGRITFHD